MCKCTLFQKKEKRNKIAPFLYLQISHAVCSPSKINYEGFTAPKAIKTLPLHLHEVLKPPTPLRGGSSNIIRQFHADSLPRKISKAIEIQEQKE